MKNTESILRSLYTNVFSQKFSPDGNLLAASDNFGNISLYRLSSILSAENITKPKYPYFKYKACNSSLYCLESSNDFLLCAPLNQIIGWKWKDLNQSKDQTKIFFNFKSSTNDGNFNSDLNIDTNSLVYDSKIDSKRLFAGCGDGNIYCFDFETSKLIQKYEAAHNDCIYQIQLKTNQNEIVSASEDGDVKIWDLRSKTNVVTISPHEHSVCSRPNLGRHINCVAVDEDNWLICGGGPRMAMWHLRSLKPMGIQEFNDELFMPNVCRIYENQIITGGNSNRLFYHTFENKFKTEINTTLNCIYDITLNVSSKSNRILCICGSGSTIDICSNFSYRALTLNL